MFKDDFLNLMALKGISDLHSLWAQVHKDRLEDGHATEIIREVILDAQKLGMSEALSINIAATAMSRIQLKGVPDIDMSSILVYVKSEGKIVLISVKTYLDCVYFHIQMLTIQPTILSLQSIRSRWYTFVGTIQDKEEPGGRKEGQEEWGYHYWFRFRGWFKLDQTEEEEDTEKWGCWILQDVSQ